MWIRTKLNIVDWWLPHSNEERSLCENLGKSTSLGRHFSGGISEKRVESTLPWPGRAMIMLMNIIMIIILPWPDRAVP